MRSSLLCALALIAAGCFSGYDSGAPAAEKLRVSVDGEALRDYIDVRQNGRDYDIDGHGMRGHWLVFEPASDDEVVIRRIRVHYERY